MRAAVIGAGKVSGEHIKAYRAVGVDVVAICSRTQQGAQHKADELGIDARAYDDLNALLAQEEVDVMSICSPPEVHAEQTIKIAQAGKHMAIEKPVALHRQELMAMHAAVEKAGVETVIGFVLRWNDLVRTIKDRYLPELGRVFYLETDYWHGASHLKPDTKQKYGTRQQAIGAFLGGGCHAVDMARFLKGQDIKDVRALTPMDHQEAIQRTTVALVTFTDGTIGKISATDEVFAPYRFNLHLFGNDGKIHLNDFYARRTGKHDSLTISGTVPDSGAVTHHPFTGMIAELVDCIKRGEDTSCNLADAMNTHLVCFAAEASARHQGTVVPIL